MRFSALTAAISSASDARAAALSARVSADTLNAFVPGLGCNALMLAVHFALERTVAVMLSRVPELDLPAGDQTPEPPLRVANPQVDRPAVKSVPNPSVAAPPRAHQLLPAEPIPYAIGNQYICGLIRETAVRAAALKAYASDSTLHGEFDVTPALAYAPPHIDARVRLLFSAALERFGTTAWRLPKL